MTVKPNASSSARLVSSPSDADFAIDLVQFRRRRPFAVRRPLANFHAWLPPCRNATLAWRPLRKQLCQVPVNWPGRRSATARTPSAKSRSCAARSARRIRDRSAPSRPRRARRAAWRASTAPPAARSRRSRAPARARFRAMSRAARLRRPGPRRALRRALMRRPVRHISAARCCADQARQGVGDAEAGMKAELDEVGGEARFGRRDAEIGDQREAETGADRRALDRGDDRLLRREQPHGLDIERIDARSAPDCRCRSARQIGAGAEILAGGRKHADAQDRARRRCRPARRRDRASTRP